MDQGVCVSFASRAPNGYALMRIFSTVPGIAENELQKRRLALLKWQQIPFLREYRYLLAKFVKGRTKAKHHPE